MAVMAGKRASTRSITLAFALGALPALGGCTFNFEVTTQRTALENQVMGSYKELEDDLVLISAVRAPSGGTTASPQKQRALDARQNQDFNRDDIDELKGLGLIGEAQDGTVALLPKGLAAPVAEGAGNAKAATLATMLVQEENRDRETIWRRIIESNENLSLKDLPEVRRTYAKMQRDATANGQWYQDESNRWVQKQ